jgi:hypothetical protein
MEKTTRYPDSIDGFFRAAARAVDNCSLLATFNHADDHQVRRFHRVD